MKILAIETSSIICSVAISTKSFFGEYTVSGNNLHDVFLADFVKRILIDAKITIKELDYIAISSGPGSFTGLRIGAALVKGLCFGTDKPQLVSVPTMNAYANSSLFFTKMFKINGICAVIPSHKNLFYIQKFNNKGTPISKIEVKTKEETDDLVNTSFIVGPEFKEITAKDILDYAKNNLDNIVNAEEFEPIYVQEFEPNVNPKTLKI